MSAAKTLFDKLRQALRTRTDHLWRALLKNIGWAAVGQAFGAGAALIETVLLARFLGLEKFGAFAVIFSATELIFGLLDFRTGEAVTKFLPEFRQARDNKPVVAFLRLIFAVDGAVAVSGICATLAFSSVAPKWLSVSSELAHLLIILALGAATKTVVRSVGAILRVTGAFALATKLGIISNLARLLLVGMGAAMAPTIATISWMAALSDFTFCLLMLAGFVSSAPSRSSHTADAGILFDRVRRQSVFKFLFSTNLASTLRTLSTKLDVLVIAALTSIGVVALYKVAARIAGTLLLFSDPLLIAVYPEIAQLHAVKAVTRLKSMLVIFTKVLSVFAGVMILAFVCCGETIIRKLVGLEYATAYPITLAMLAGASIAMIFFWARPLLLVYGMANQLVIVGLIVVCVKFAALYLLVPIWGALGAGLAFSLYYVLSILMFLSLIFARERDRLPVWLAH